MTDRKGLADRLELIVAELQGLPHVVQTCKEAARALRQEPSVEEIASAIAATIDANHLGDDRIEVTGINEAAQAIAALYSGSRRGE